MRWIFFVVVVYFFRFVFVFVSNHNLPFGFFPSILTAGPLQFRGVFVINVFRIGSLFHCACIAYRDMEHLKSSESTPTKLQNDRPSPEIPDESHASLWREGIWLFRWNRVDPALAVSRPRLLLMLGTSTSWLQWWHVFLLLLFFGKFDIHALLKPKTKRKIKQHLVHWHSVMLLRIRLSISVA